MQVNDTLNERGKRYGEYGMPQGKARPRFTRQGRAYTPKQTRDNEADIKAAAAWVKAREGR